jgi:hypothetical protein
MQTASSKCTGAAVSADDGDTAGTCSGSEQLAPAVLQCLAKEVAGVVAPKVSFKCVTDQHHTCVLCCDYCCYYWCCAAVSARMCSLHAVYIMLLDSKVYTNNTVFDAVCITLHITVGLRAVKAEQNADTCW